MFQSAKKRIEAMLDVVDDMLAGAPEAEALAPAPHPHRRPVELRMQRRAGSVTPRAMHCLCPVRPAPSGREDEARRARSG